MNKTALKMK